MQQAKLYTPTSTPAGGAPAQPQLQAQQREARAAIGAVVERLRKDGPQARLTPEETADLRKWLGQMAATGPSACAGCATSCVAKAAVQLQVEPAMGSSSGVAGRDEFDTLPPTARTLIDTLREYITFIDQAYRIGAVKQAHKEEYEAAFYGGVAETLRANTKSLIGDVIGAVPPDKNGLMVETLNNMIDSHAGSDESFYFIHGA